MIQSLSLTTQNYYRIAVSAFYFTQGLVFSSWASRIPDIRSALHLNEAALGSVLFAIPVGQLSAMALSGYLVSRYGSRRMLLVASLFYPAILVTLGLVNSVWMLSVALFFFGMAANLNNIAVNTQGVGVERIYGRSIMATFHGLWSMAGFTGGLISAWMVGSSVSPFIHFCFIFAVSMLILIALWNSTLPRDLQNGSPGDKKVFVRPDRYIVLLGVIAFGSMACEGTMFDWSGVYFEDIVNPPRAWVRLGYIACMCTMTCGRFMADRLVTRFGVINVIRCSGLIITTGLLISVFLPHLVTATIGFLLVGFGISSIVPICYSLAGRSRTMLPGVALATVSSIGFLGFLLGPPIIGFVAQVLDLRWSFALVSSIGLLTALLAPALRASLDQNQDK